MADKEPTPPGAIFSAALKIVQDLQTGALEGFVKASEAQQPIKFKCQLPLCTKELSLPAGSDLRKFLQSGGQSLCCPSCKTLHKLAIQAVDSQGAPLDRP